MIELRDDTEERAWIAFAAAVMAGWFTADIDQLPEAPPDETAAGYADLLVELFRQRRRTVPVLKPVPSSAIGGGGSKITFQ